MLEALSHLFAAVCGQNLDHTWAPGGMLLPCCQRCAGLYAGAAVATLLHLWLRPKLSSRFLEVHGAFLLAMVPFGFHWVAQSAELRTLIGVLFGFGVVTFLWLPLQCRAGASPASPRMQSATRDYRLILGTTLIVLPLAAKLGGAAVAYVLSGLITCGALALSLLAIADVGLGVLAAIRWVRCPPRRRIEA